MERRLLVLYGTQTGTAKALALRTCRLAVKRGASEVRCLPADEVPLMSWPTFGVPVLLFCSNASQGAPPTTFRKTWSDLLSPDAPSLAGLSYAVFGLGHGLYKRFNYVGKITHNRLEQLGATPLVLRGLGRQTDPAGLDGELQPWLATLWKVLGWLSADEATAMTKEDTSTYPIFPLYTLRYVEGAAEAVLGNPRLDAAAEATRVTYNEPTILCEVVQNERLTPPDHFQAVHFLKLRLLPPANDAAAQPAAGYEVGDALGVYCPNRPEQVDTLLRLLALSGDEVVVVTPDGAHGLVEQPREGFFGKPMTLRYLLSYYFDLDVSVSQEFFYMLSHFVGGGAHENDAEAVQEVRERLQQLGDTRQIQDYFEYAYMEKRNVCEVLADFRLAQPPLEVLLSFMHVMQPRHFSIASSPLMDPLPTIDLAVARIEWQTAMRRQRSGLCSSYMTASPVGRRLVCFFWTGMLTMPHVPTPLLCIAAGTGVAPIRSMLRQCAAQKAWADTPIYLFFGCRHKDKDFYFANEWQELRESGALRKLTVIPAFSRDTNKKVYVQHQLGENARLVGSLLAPDAGTVIYLCGNAKLMPRDVEGALEQVLQACVFNGDLHAARNELKRLTQLGRFQEDTWST